MGVLKMAELLSLQDMANGHLDVKALGVAANGDENTEVITRTGETYWSAKKALRIMTELGIGFTAFETKATLDADSVLQNGAYAVVTNDVIEKIGVYLKKLGAWVRVPWNNFSNLDELRVNKDKDYPLSILVRSASSSNKQQIYFKQALVGAEVVNARKGYYYRFAYMQNGQVFAGVDQNYGVIIERVNILTKVTQKLTNYTDYDVQLIPDRAKGGLQTFDLKCVADPLTTIKVTIDVDALVGDGKAITSTSTSYDGYNSIIHPKNHYYFNDLSFTASDMLVNYDYTGKLSVSYLSKTKWYRLDFARKSENLTLQNAGFGYAEAYGEFGDLIPPEYVKFVTRTEADSDWHSPLQIRAVSNGDAGATVIYTGGAHSKDGNTAGGATARSRNITILVDGIAIDPTKNLLAKCKAVSCLVTNQLMAYNTIATDRYVLEQNYRYDISPKGQYVAVSYKALEDIVIEKDNGLQAYMAGMTPITNNTYLFVGGSQIERKSVTETSFNSGLKSAYPDAYGVVIRHPVAGEMSVWIDNKYGVGDRQYLASTRPLFEHAVSSSTKIYARLIDGVELPLSKNKSYQWRGGMYWGMPTNTAYQDAVLQTQAGSLLVSVDGSYAIV